MEKLANSSHFLDLNGLDSLRTQAQRNEKSAIKEVAQQFEGIFVQMLMKSMRDANEVFKSDSPFNSQYTAFYEQMRDQQLSMDLSDKGMLGLADLMVQQLSPENSNFTPASVLRQDPFAAQSAGTLTQKSVSSVNPAQSESQSSSRIIDKQTIDDLVSGKILPSEATPQFEDKNDFIDRLYPHAEKAAEKLGTSPEVLIAQSALETGWGKKMTRQSNGELSNNLFNIKAGKDWQGESTRVNTLEFEQGVAVKQKADFRVYDDLKQSFDDFVNFISDGERYQDALKVAAKPEQFMQAIQKAGYATDPNYANKVISVMKSIAAK